jgi:hypothetical protein
MVAIVKSWRTPRINLTLGSTTDQVIQYQQGMLELKDEFLAAGWAVERCSIGPATPGGVPGTTDLWGVASNAANRANIVFAAEGTSHSWIVLLAPASLGQPTGADRFRLLLNCTNAAGDTTPNTFAASMFLRASTTGTLLNAPTASAGPSTTALTIQLLLTNTAQAARMHLLTTTTGELVMMTKALADTAVTSIFAVCVGSDEDPYSLQIVHSSSLTNASNAINVMTIRHFTGDGLTAIGTSTTAQSRAAAKSAWTDPRNWHGEVEWNPIIFISNATGTASRDLGAVADWYMLPGPASGAFNVVDAADTDAWRLRGFGVLAFPLPAALAGTAVE